MKLKLPYKITSRDLPEYGTLVRGRGFGLNSLFLATAFSIAGIIVTMVFQGYFYIIIPATVLGVAIVCVISSYAEHIVIEISGGFLLLRISFWGLTREEVWTGLDKLVIRHDLFREHNKELRANNYRDQLWELGFDNGWDGPFDQVYINKGQKEISFNSSQKEFETELWSKTIEALKKALQVGDDNAGV